MRRTEFIATIVMLAAASILLALASHHKHRAHLIPPISHEKPSAAPSASTASRDFARPSLSWPSSTALSVPLSAQGVIPAVIASTVTPSRPAAATIQTSPSANSSGLLRGVIGPQPSRSVTQTSAGPSSESNVVGSTADDGAGPSSGEAAGPAPTQIADKNGTLKQRIAWCESRGLNVINPSSGASGFWQFLDSTFEAVTGLPGKASDYPLSVQSAAFDELYALRGTQPWDSSRSCWQVSR